MGIRLFLLCFRVMESFWIMQLSCTTGQIKDSGCTGNCTGASRGTGSFLFSLWQLVYFCKSYGQFYPKRLLHHWGIKNQPDYLSFRNPPKKSAILPFIYEKQIRTSALWPLADVNFMCIGMKENSMISQMRQWSSVIRRKLLEIPGHWGCLYPLMRSCPHRKSLIRTAGGGRLNYFFVKARENLHWINIKSAPEKGFGVTG